MYKVLKNFLSLQKNDIIEVHTFGNDEFSFYVSGRLSDVKEYIKHATILKLNKTYNWVKKEQQPFTSLSFKIPVCPKDLTEEFKNLYTQNDWVKLCIENYINELIDLEIIIKI